MARFFKLQFPTNVDYIEPFTGGRGSGRSATTPTDSIFGKANILDEDTPRFREKIAEYRSKIDPIVKQLTVNPNDPNARAEIRNLKEEIQMDRQHGEWGAMERRYKKYNEMLGDYRTLMKDSPYEFQEAVNRIDVTPLNYDPATQTYGDVIGSEVATPWTAEREGEMFDRAKTFLEEKLLEEAKRENIKLNRHETLTTLTNKLGYTKDDVNKLLASSVSPDDMRSLVQFYDYRGLPQDEINFYDPTTNEFNMDSNLGLKFSNLVDAIAGTTKIDMKTIKSGKFPTSSSKGRGSDIEDKAQYYYDRISGIIEGDAFKDITNLEKEARMEDIATTDLFEGLELPTGEVLYDIKVGKDGRLGMTTVEEVPQRGGPSKKIYKNIPFNFPNLRSAIIAEVGKSKGNDVADAVYELLKRNGYINEAAEVPDRVLGRVDIDSRPFVGPELDANWNSIQSPKPKVKPPVVPASTPDNKEEVENLDDLF
jgi:hypothetical protein